jgi:hypothetical protein
VSKDIDLIFSGRERFTDVDGGGSLFDELKDVTHARVEKLEGVIRDYCSTIKGGSEPQMEGVVCHTGQ